MSAPEVQVRRAEERAEEMREWRYTRPDGTTIQPAFLDELCDAYVALARRDEAVRALIEQVRKEADKLQAAALTHPYGSTGSLSCTVLAGAARGHADELERAIGGGR